MDGYVLTQGRAHSFYPEFERKGDDPAHTHYCPGCGHGILQKLIARAIDELGIQDRTIFVSPVGCSVFAYYYFDTGNVQAAHGRAPAVATAIKRARPESIVLSYQGDGDLAAIGTAEIIHAANRGEPFTVIFANNAIYGMTGGQAAPTTPLEVRTPTTPFGRSAYTDGMPLRMSELIAALDAPVYVERVALGNNKQIVAAGRAIRRAIEAQVRGLGFSFVEVLSPCPTIWKLDPVHAQQRVREELTAVFPLGVFEDRRSSALPRPAPVAAMDTADIPDFLGVAGGSRVEGVAPPGVDLAVKIGGFGGQGVLLLGEILAEAGMRCGLEVSWLPSYGPEMRSGTSNCSVRLCSAAVDSPVVSRPNVLIALNEPSLRKFLPAVEPGGLVLFNADSGACSRSGVTFRAVSFTAIANELGDVRTANMVALGALLAAFESLSIGAVESALRARFAGEDLAVNLRAIAQGMERGRYVSSDSRQPGCLSQ